MPSVAISDCVPQTTRESGATCKHLASHLNTTTAATGNYILRKTIINAITTERDGRTA